jgi:hypothetical protein
MNLTPTVTVLPTTLGASTSNFNLCLLAMPSLATPIPEGTTHGQILTLRFNTGIMGDNSVESMLSALNVIFPKSFARLFQRCSRFGDLQDLRDIWDWRGEGRRLLSPSSSTRFSLLSVHMRAMLPFANTLLPPTCEREMRERKEATERKTGEGGGSTQ